MTPEDATKAIKDSSYLEYDLKSGQEDMDPALYKKAIDDYHQEVKENPEAYEEILKYNGVVMK